MKITVGTNAQFISELLTDIQKSAVVRNKDDKKFSLAFQVPSGVNVYLEGAGLTATTTDSFNITTTNISLQESQFADMSIIAEAENTDVIILAA